MKTTLSRRLTHNFNSGYSYLDEYEVLGTAEILVSKTKYDKHGESFRRTVVLDVDLEGEEREPDEVENALADMFDTSCRCEHDCCGHVSTFASKIRKMSGGKYVVRVNGSRNI